MPRTWVCHTWLIFTIFASVRFGLQVHLFHIVAFTVKDSEFRNSWFRYAFHILKIEALVPLVADVRQWDCRKLRRLLPFHFCADEVLLDKHTDTRGTPSPILWGWEDGAASQLLTPAYISEGPGSPAFPVQYTSLNTHFSPTRPGF